MKLLASVIFVLFATSIGSPLFDEIYAQTEKEVKVSIPKGTSIHFSDSRFHLLMAKFLSSAVIKKTASAC